MLPLRTSNHQVSSTLLPAGVWVVFCRKPCICLFFRRWSSRISFEVFWLVVGLIFELKKINKSSIRYLTIFPFNWSVCFRKAWLWTDNGICSRFLYWMTLTGTVRLCLLTDLACQLVLTDEGCASPRILPWPMRWLVLSILWRGSSLLRRGLRL